MTPNTSNSVIPMAANSPTGFNSATNQISTPGIFSYDNGGNLTALNGNTLAYDAEKRLKSVSGLGVSETISYDATGRRVQKSLSSGSTAYVYDAFGNLSAEYANGTTWSRDYIRWGGGQLIATENASGPCTTCYLSHDHLGSVRLVTDANANVIARHDYLPYGEEIAAGIDGRNSQFGLTTDTTANFTGQLRDQEAGQDYFNARYFAASLGRFHSPDPGSAGADPTDPQTWNGYAYVRNSPLQMVDPSGMDGFTGGDPGNPGDDGNPCDDPFACGPFPGPIGPTSPPSAPAPPPTQTESESSGPPIPRGSFPNGEALGLPGGLGLPGPFGRIGGNTPCDFGTCTQVIQAAGGPGDPATNPQQFLNYALLQAALILLRRSQIMASVMRYADDPSRTITIRFNSNNVNTSSPAGGKISWDPHSALVCPGDTGVPQPPSVGLAEELAHQYNPVGHVPLGPYDDSEEYRVRELFINNLAASLGSCTRSNHLGTLAHVP